MQPVQWKNSLQMWPQSAKSKDNDGEYLGEFKDVRIKQSIKHELSSPYTPQQNGTAERSWRTAFDMARCLLLDSELPKNLWSYALLTSGYTRNCCYQQRTGSMPYQGSCLTFSLAGQSGQRKSILAGPQ